MKQLILLFFISLSYLSFSQAANNDCGSATEICDSQPKTGSTNGATSSVCATCSDGATVVGSACFDMHKTVWFQFTTTGAGAANIAVSGINCTAGFNGVSGIVYNATTPCNSATYTAVSNCVANSTVDFTLNAAGLIAGRTYYVLIGSDVVSECGFDIEVTGPAVMVAPPTIVISNDAGTTIVCPEDVVNFFANTINCTNPVVDWYVDGGYTATTRNGDPFSRDYFVDGSTVNAIVNCDCGPFSISNILTVNVHPYITVDAGPYTNIPFGASTKLFGTGGVTYSWAPIETLNDPNIQNPTATPLSTTTYFMTATSTEGCNFYSEVIVNVLDSVFIPNVFTPNSDGVNDTWEIKLIDLYPKAEITVFDRWGQVVFKTIGYPTSARWDGTFNGKQLPASTYYFTVSLSIDSEAERIRTGYVTIIY